MAVENENKLNEIIQAFADAGFINDVILIGSWCLSFYVEVFEGFGSNPEFIYGIHWLPTGEYLTNYALGSSEKAVLKTIYSEMENRCGGAPRTWFSNLWAIEAIVDSAKALNDFDATKIQGDDYKDELAGSYWMAHGLNTYGQKFTQGYFEVNGSASGTVYEKNGALTGMVWNPGGDTNVTYVNGDKMVSYSVPAHSFIKISL